jgi:hypothetical protein
MSEPDDPSGSDAEAPDPQGEVILDALLEPRVAALPGWARDLDGLILAVCGVGAPDAQPPPADADAFERVGPGRWAWAWVLRDPADAARRLAPLRAWAGLNGLRMGAALSEGAVSPRAVLGDAPAQAAALVACASGGLLVDGRLRAAVAEPALVQGPGFRLGAAHRASQWPAWVGAVAFAAAALLAVWVMRPAADAPQAFIWVATETVRALRPAVDRVVVTVEGTPGATLTLLVLDSEGRLSAPDDALVDRRLGARRVTKRFALEGPAGAERFLAVVSPAPLDTLQAEIEALNARRLPRRAVVDRLRVLLRARGATLADGPDVLHGP